MSRLIKPAPGECADRQGILQIKMEHADTGEAATRQGEDRVATDGETTWGVNRTVLKGASKINIEPFKWEHEDIQQYLEKNWFINFPQNEQSWELLFDALKEVNQRLWKLQDEARVLRQATKTNAVVYRGATCLWEIDELNEKRSDLVKEINHLFGVDVVEKIYA